MIILFPGKAWTAASPVVVNPVPLVETDKLVSIRQLGEGVEGFVKGLSAPPPSSLSVPPRRNVEK